MTVRSGFLFAGFGLGMLGARLNSERPVLAVDSWVRACDQLRHMQRLGWFSEELEILHMTASQFSKEHASDWTGRLDILHSSPPCPNWSSAKHGARGGNYDGWPDTLESVRRIRPEWVALENVANFKREHRRVRTDLQGLGYTYQAIILPASAVGAPHRRDRYWGLAHADNQGEPMLPVDAETQVVPAADCGVWEHDPRSARVADGDSDRADRFVGLGNGQVPQQAALAMRVLGGPWS